MIAGILVGAALAIACVLVVALPYLREPAAETDELGLPTAKERLLLQLAEDRDRALAALKELEADHRGGRIGDADYRALVGPLRREAAEALRALDALLPAAPPGAAPGRQAAPPTAADGAAAAAVRRSTAPDSSPRPS